MNNDNNGQTPDTHETFQKAWPIPLGLALAVFGTGLSMVADAWAADLGMGLALLGMVLALAARIKN